VLLRHGKVHKISKKQNTISVYISSGGFDDESKKEGFGFPPHTYREREIKQTFSSKILK
jgi:hypothetical protein